MYRINHQILKYFVKCGKLSTLRFFVYVQNRFNNHIHKSQFKEIRDDLNISDQVIQKNIRQLIELGICEDKFSHYWRLNSWKKWSPVAKNRITEIELIKLRDLKYLRSLYYSLYYKSAYYCSKKNYKSKRDKRHASRGLYEVSASFVQKVTGIERTIQTLNNHINRCNNYGIVNLKKSFKIHYESIFLDKVINCKNHIGIDNCIIKMFRNKYVLITYRSHMINFN